MQTMTTDGFIAKYLSPDLKYNRTLFIEAELANNWRVMYLEYESGGVNHDDVQKYVNDIYPKNIPERYDDYRQTPWWIYLSTQFKKIIGHCQFSDEHPKDRLEVHHYSYKYYGREANHEEDLLCLCHSCHNGNHWNFWKKNNSNGNGKTDYHENILNVDVLNNLASAYAEHKDLYADFNCLLETAPVVHDNDDSIHASVLRIEEAAIMLEILNHLDRRG
jgi:hypothetical protein